jgi:hypothetical protein
MDRNKEKANNQWTWTGKKNKAPKQVHPSKAKPMTKAKKSTQMRNGTEIRSHRPISPHPSTHTQRFFFVRALLLTTSTSGTLLPTAAFSRVFSAVEQEQECHHHRR